MFGRGVSFVTWNASLTMEALEVVMYLDDRASTYFFRSSLSPAANTHLSTHSLLPSRHPMPHVNSLYSTVPSSLSRYISHFSSFPLLNRLYPPPYILATELTTTILPYGRSFSTALG